MGRSQQGGGHINFMGNTMEKLSIIVPCYNEEECIPLFYGKVTQIIEQLPLEPEFIFVDDGSTDRSLEIMRSLAEKDGRVRYVSFSRNFGKEAAILAGLKASTGELVTLMDADLQDPPELLKEMYKGICEGYDCVGCRRTTRKNEPKVRSAFAHLFYRIINKFTDTRIVDGARDFRMMTRKMTDAILSLPEVDRFSKELFSWVGFKTKWLEYENVERARGKSKWNFKKLTAYAINGIEGATCAPLKFNLIFGIIFLIAAIGLAVADIVLAATGQAVHTALIVLPVTAFIAATIFFGMHIMGEYLRKIFTQVRSRPMYVVAETEKDDKTRGNMA